VAGPVIGISADLRDGYQKLSSALTDAVERAGGVPVILPSLPQRAAELAALCDGAVLSGGDDPIMEPWGIPTHPAATPLDPRRQEFELAFLAALDSRPRVPVLGICLGMQLMGLHCGATLDQHLPDTLETACLHRGRRTHPVQGALGNGLVHSNHDQALSDPGRLEVVARAPDGVIEGVRDPGRPLYLGVQWHPERTADPALGPGLLRMLVRAACGPAVI
jgi:putative glutamine amidotransferase